MTTIWKDEWQSEFIHMQHYSAGLALGIILLLISVILIVILTAIDEKNIFPRVKYSASPIYFLILLQVSLTLLLIFTLLNGTIIYTIGGVVVLLVTIFPLYSARREKNRLKTDK
ncbi:MAG: hypothetical protein ACW97A_04215 [Candidatus Thorarchaeota archaeon]|jgi:hypothetical protein